MRQLSVAVVTVCTIALSQIASAADLPRKAPAYTPPSPPIYSWTGFYVGGNAGYGWKDQTVTFTPNDALANAVTCGGGACAPPTSFNISGVLGGLQVGYNWQINQNWLLGFETDFNWSNIKGTGTSSFLMLATYPSNFQASETVRWFGTVRVRAGFLPTHKLLLFATGGFAYGRVDENVALNSTITGVSGPGGFSFFCTGAPLGPGAANCFVGNSSRTGTGFTVGGGGEYALWSNLSVRAEYLYVNLGQGDPVNVLAQVGFPPPSFTAAYSTLDFHVVRGGVNWKF